MEVSSNWASVTTCCRLDDDSPPESRCYWNVTTLRTIVSDERYDITPMYSIRPIPCSNNIICYNGSSSFLFDDATSVSGLTVGGLSCKFGDRDNCYESVRPIAGPDTFVAACKLLSDIYSGGPVFLSPEASDIYNIIMLCISLPFLVATFLVYTIVPELQNLHGLILRSYISSCFMTFVLNIASYISFMEGDLFCHDVFDIGTLFALLATVFWLNVMCADIWWTFRAMRIRKHQSSRKKCIVYSIYAWGSAVLIIVIGFIKDIIEDLPQATGESDPRTDCWLYGWNITNVYIQGVLLFTLSSDICFFVLVVVEITCYKRDTARHLEGNDSERHNDEKHRFTLYLKLSVLMGLSWIAEVMPYWPALILDLPNMMQGLVIFLLFVCNARTRRLLSSRLGCKDWKITKSMRLFVSRIPMTARRPSHSKFTPRTIETDLAVGGSRIIDSNIEQCLKV